jgi:hypothetical protein
VQESAPQSHCHAGGVAAPADEIPAIDASIETAIESAYNMPTFPES